MIKTWDFISHVPTCFFDLWQTEWGKNNTTFPVWVISNHSRGTIISGTAAEPSYSYCLTALYNVSFPCFETEDVGSRERTMQYSTCFFPFSFPFPRPTIIWETVVRGPPGPRPESAGLGWKRHIPPGPPQGPRRRAGNWPNNVRAYCSRCTVHVSIFFVKKGRDMHGGVFFFLVLA